MSTTHFWRRTPARTTRGLFGGGAGSRRGREGSRTTVVWRRRPLQPWGTRLLGVGERDGGDARARGERWDGGTGGGHEGTEGAERRHEGAEQRCDRLRERG
jgi:hypothetical protein